MTQSPEELEAQGKLLIAKAKRARKQLRQRSESSHDDPARRILLRLGIRDVNANSVRMNSNTSLAQRKKLWKLLEAHDNS